MTAFMAVTSCIPGTHFVLSKFCPILMFSRETQHLSFSTGIFASRKKYDYLFTLILRPMTSKLFDWDLRNIPKIRPKMTIIYVICFSMF